MKKLIILVCTALWLASCGENIEEKAGLKLQAARQALEEGNFSEVKTQIDSIKILYPRATNARNEGIKLMQQADLKEQQQSLIYLDSMMQEKQQAFEKIKGQFILEKDAEYQETGNYFWPTQVVEKNLHRSYLRFQVDERGIMSMTSIYCGSGNIHHAGVKVIAPDGTFAETPASKDSYETTDMGEKIEKADYKLGADGNVIAFIHLNRDKNIRVEYIGDKKYATTMSPTDRKAAAKLYELSQILSAIEQIKKEQKEANLKIQFVTKKIESKAEAEKDSKTNTNN